MPYEFTQDSYREFSEAILGANGDQATLTVLLSDMQDTFNQGIADLTATRETNDSVSKENERLKQSNMDLFLRLGTPESPNQQQQEPEKPLSTAEYMEQYFKRVESKK